MKNKITALIFIKKNSERVPGKNFRPFNGKPLFTIILDRLDKMECIDKILVDTDSEEVLEYVSHLQKGVGIERPVELSGDTISANELIKYDIEYSEAEHFFQTHCTNPLLTENTIEFAIEQYFAAIPQYDSLFSVTKIQNRVYYDGRAPINHAKGKTLRTQDLTPVFEENASFFIFSRTSFVYSGGDRIGSRPLLFEVSPIEAVDIDYEEDFLLAELIDRNKKDFPQIFGKA